MASFAQAGFAKIAVCVVFAFLAVALAGAAPAQAQAQGPKLEELASMKAPNAAQIAVKRSLRLPVGEFSVGAPAGPSSMKAIRSPSMST
jgi:hypothetical protein